MIRRRDFLASCVATMGFGARAAVARTARTAPQRRVVRVNGRRVRTVDIHSHCLVPAAAALLNQQPNRRELLPLSGDPLAARLAAMDVQGIDIAVLSVTPSLNWYTADRDVAAKVVELQNRELAAFCAAHRDRFAALASVALQFPDLAVEQLDVAVKQLGHRGVAIATPVGTRELSDPVLHPFWSRTEELGVPVFVHPAATADPARRLTGNGVLANAIGNPLELTIALSHLIFEGTLDRFPRLRMCLAHGGGYLPSYAHRSDRSCAVFPELCTPGQPKKTPSEYLKNLYYDSLVFTPEGLRHLAAEVGARRILLGTDSPFPWVEKPVDAILNAPGLSDADRAAMLGGTASQLLDLGEPL